MLTLQHPLLFVLSAHSRPMNLQRNVSKQPRPPSNRQLGLFSQYEWYCFGSMFSSASPPFFDVYCRLDQPTTTPARFMTSPLSTSTFCEYFHGRALSLLDCSGKILAHVYKTKTVGRFFHLGGGNSVDLSERR